jgi:hypothetical protein
MTLGSKKKSSYRPGPLGRRPAALALVAGATLLLAAVGVAAAELSPPKFVALGEGTLTDHSLTPQVFHLEKGGGNYVVCEAEHSEGEVKERETKEQEVRVNYEKCTAHTSIGEYSVTVSPAHYNFHAEGSVDVVEPITIEGVPFCTITVPKQTGLKTITYTNSGNNIIVEAKVTGIKEESCLGTSTTGTYFGNVAETEPAKSEVTLNNGATKIEFVE